jgi:hypothetical protein
MSRKINIFNASCQDADVLAFMTAAAINDSTILNALCVLVTSLKSNGVWAKCNAIYPMVGGTATTHKFNLKNPADTNAAFRLSFVGGWTHSSNGALPNGTTAYADTFFTPSSSLAANTANISYYRRTTGNTTSATMGVIANTRLVLVPNYNAFGFNNISEIVGNSQVNRGAINTLGLISGNRISSTEFKIIVNGGVVETVARTATVQPNLSIFLGANRQNAVAANFSTDQCAFASIGSGLTDGEALLYYNAIQQFQTSLSRQV